MKNNTTKYEAFLTGLRIDKDMGARMIKICTDSQLVASQVTGGYQVREEHIQEYVKLV
jgi:ribonuclease HI